MNEVINLIKSHKSVRKYLSKPIEDEILMEILASAQAASTSSFKQAYSIIGIKDIEKRKILTKLCGEQSYIEECPVFLVFCADLNKLSVACNMNELEMDKGYTESFIIGTVDAALAAQNALIAAESLGIGGVYIGGIRNNPKDVSELLELPKGVYAVFGMCLGYPNENNEIKLRLPLEAVYFEDKYSLNERIDYIKSYDKAVSDYYIERTGGKRNDTWTNQMAQLNSKPQRPHMKEFLRDQGFDMK